MIVLDANQVLEHLPMREAIDAMRDAFLSISSGAANFPRRSHLDIPKHHGTTLIMPAHAEFANEETLAVKVATVYDENPAKGLPRVLASVLVFDPKTGAPTALLDGTQLTAVRTAAASAAATDELAREQSSTLGLIGSGVQARTHLKAISIVRSIEKCVVYSRKTRNVEQFIEEVAPDHSEIEFQVSKNVASLLQMSDVVCTCTNASTPLFDAADVRPGTHFNVIGSHQPHAAEVPGELVARSRVFVDHLDTAIHEAGDLIQPTEAGLMQTQDICGEVGQLIAGEIRGRQSDSDITLFKSVGNAVEDAVAANLVIKNFRNSNPPG